MKFLSDHPIRRAIMAAGVLCSIVPVSAQAQEVTLIRDAEIEKTIEVYAAPIFQAAGFGKRDVEVTFATSERLV